MVLEKESSAPHSNPPRTEGGADDRLHQSDYTHGVLIDAGRWVKKNQPSPSNGRPSAASPTQGWARVLLCCVFFSGRPLLRCDIFFLALFCRRGKGAALCCRCRGPRRTCGPPITRRRWDAVQSLEFSSLFYYFFFAPPFFCSVRVRV